MKLLDKIKQKYRQDAVTTLFMGTALGIAILTYIKPDGTLSANAIATSIGLSIINLLLLVVAVLSINHFLRK